MHQFCLLVMSLHQIKEQLLDKVKSGYMTDLYREVCGDLKLPVNNSVLEEMQAKNKEELDKISGITSLYSIVILSGNMNLVNQITRYIC